MKALRRMIGVALPPLAVFVLAAVLAEFLLRFLAVPEYVMPRPSAVFEAMGRQAGDLWGSLLSTGKAAVAGFVLSGVIGIALAVGLSSHRLVQRAFYPYAVFFQTVPIVAIAPLLVIWFDFGIKSVAMSALIASVFPVIANALAGLLSTDPALRDLFRLHGASAMTTLLKLRLPSALPNIVTGLRIAAGLAVIGAIVGEFVAGVIDRRAGLGILILIAKRNGSTDLIFAAVLAASMLGLAMLGAVNAAGWLLLRRWHASERD